MENWTALESALLTAAPPYLHLVETARAELERWACIFERPEQNKPIQLSRFLIRGWQCRTTTQLFNEFAASLQFPSHFGRNWDAFEDCLTDLDWWHGQQSGYVLYMLHADELLVEEPEPLPIFLDILHSAGEYWRQQLPSVSFHAVFQVAMGMHTAPFVQALERSTLPWQHVI